MSSEARKSWEKPWTTEEIIEHAPNWSLAGDVGLLKHLESFSDSILSKCNETNGRLDKLLDDLDRASLQLDVVKNEFFGLHNTQFIESRVYEDDETLPDEGDKKMVEEKVSNEDDRKRAMKEALDRGLEVIEQCFDKVEVSVSDSEDDTNFPSYILRPKDPYIDRPLPYVIGTEEWYKKVHVGLEDSSSESETDKLSEKFSETDSESELPISNLSQVKVISDSSSEEFSNKIGNDNHNANSTLISTTNNNNNNNNKTDMFASSDSEGTNSLPAQPPISNANFAEQLAAKLGGMIDKAAKEEVINKKPIQKYTNASKYSGLFFDEPPPLDEPDDLFDERTEKGLFSSSKGLFDDDDDETYWGQKQDVLKKAVNKPVNDLFADDADNDFIKPVKEAKTVIDASNIFEDEASDEDLFGTNKTETKKPYLQPFKTTPPIFDEEPPALETETVKKKKPIGGVAVLGQNLFDDKTKPKVSNQNEPAAVSKTIERVSTDITTNKISALNNDENKNEDNSVPPSISKNVSLFSDDDDVDVSKKQSAPKSINLFDDDNLFEHDIFSDANTKKFTSNLFDDEPLSSDLFSPGKISQGGEKTDKPNPVSLFDSDPPPDLDEWDSKSADNLFDDEPMSYDANDYSSRQSVSLFDNEPPSLFLDDTSGIVKDHHTRQESCDVSFVPEASSSRRLSSDIFSEQQSNDSIFLTKNQSESLPVQQPPSLQIIPETSTISNETNQNDIFHDEYSDLFGSKTNEGNVKRKDVSLFDDDSMEDDLFFSSNETNNTNTFDQAVTEQSIVSVEAKTKDTNKEDDKTFVETEDVKINDVSKNEIMESKNETKESTIKPVPSKKPLKTETANDEISQKKSSPGKLKHSLNINVEALKPGFGPPKKRELPKSHSLEITGSETNDVISKSASDANISDNGEQTNRFATPAGIGGPTDSVEILHSYTKDRVRIPIKRRPSSRRARKELMKRSDDDFKLQHDDTSDAAPNLNETLFKKIDSDLSEKAQKASTDAEVQKIVTEVTRSYLKSEEPLFKTADDNQAQKDLESKTDKEEEPLFETIDSDQTDNKARKDLVATESAQEEPLFKTIENYESDKKTKITSADTESTQSYLKSSTIKQDGSLFKTIDSNRSHKKAQKTLVDTEVQNPYLRSNVNKPHGNIPDSHLFSGSDDDDDLFGSLSKKPGTPVSTNKPNTNKKDVNRKDTNDSLFGSPDSDNDLFAPSKTEPTQTLLAVAETKERRPSVVKSDNFATPEFDKPELFDDGDDDEDDIFSAKKLPPKSDIFKKSLFGDDPDDDDDDIFSTTPALKTNKTAEAAKPVVDRRTQKTSSLRKLDNTVTLDDPLDALKK